MRSGTAVVPPAQQAATAGPPAQQTTAAVLQAGMQSRTAIVPPAPGTSDSGATTDCGTEFANFCIAAINPASIRVNWAARTDATHYRIRSGGQILTEVAAPAREFVDESLTPGQTAEYTLEALRAAGSANVGLGAFPPTLNESGRNADGSRSVNAGDSSQRLTRFASLQTAPAKSATTPTLAMPTGVTARSFGPKGGVRVSWSEVPGANGYLVYRDGNPLPVDTVRANYNWIDDTGAPLGRRKYQVEALFTAPTSRRTVNGAASAEVFAVVVRQPIPFLSLPAGVGSYAITMDHYRSQCIDALLPGSLCRASSFLNAATNWEQAWFAWDHSNSDGAPARWPRVLSRSQFDLGGERQSNCAPPRNGTITCWALSHEKLWNQPNSLSVIIMTGDRSFFGVWEVTGDTLPLRDGAWRVATEMFDVEFTYALYSTLVAGSALDSQGRKNVPQACLSCHGGTYDASTRRVVGASLLPMIPARSSPMNADDGVKRVFTGAEENTRALNQIVLQSNPAAAIVDQINALYDGQPNTPGKTANNTAVPTGWRTQAGLYKKVIEPYCSQCHFAQRGPLSLRTWSDALQNKDAIQRTVCTQFTMPHAEVPFQEFWRDGNGAAAELLSTSLGFAKCL
jgi:hypothetical protein